MRKIWLAALLCALILLVSCNGADISDETRPETETHTLPVTETAPVSGTEAEETKSGPITVTFVPSDPKAGKVGGKTVQTLLSGVDPAAKVIAIPSLGYTFVGWSDGCGEIERKGEIFRSDREITALFAPDYLDLPVIFLTTETGCEVASKTEYVGGTIEIRNGGERPELDVSPILIRGRGNNTWSYEKKSYKIKLETKKNLLGCADGKGKTWVLLANMCDQSLLRNRFALSMGRDLNHIPFEPHTCPVEVYLNGEYRGCYLLSEEIKVDGKRVPLDEDAEAGEDIGYLVELSYYAAGEAVFSVDTKTYQVRSDLSENASLAQKQVTFIRNYLTRAMAAIRNGDEEKVRELIDVDAAVDAYLLEEVTKNLDLGWDSFYLSKDKGGKLMLGPGWDFDLSFGNGDEGCEEYDGLYAGVSKRGSLSNPWFYRLMRLKWFRTLVIARWEEMLPTFRSYPDRIRAEGKAGMRSYERNFDKWKIFGKRMNRETAYITSLSTYEEHYLYFAQWVENRLDWLDGCFRSEEFLRGDLTPASGVTPEDDPPEEEKPVRDEEKIKEWAALLPSLSDVTDKAKVTEGSGSPFGDEVVGNLADGTDGTKYCCTVEGALTVRFRFDEPTVLRGAVLVTGNDTVTFPDRSPTGWTLCGSDAEHGEWTELTAVRDASLPAENKTAAAFPFENEKAFTYYKWVFTGMGSIFQLSEIRVYS